MNRSQSYLVQPTVEYVFQYQHVSYGSHKKQSSRIVQKSTNGPTEVGRMLGEVGQIC